MTTRTDECGDVCDCWCRKRASAIYSIGVGNVVVPGDAVTFNSLSHLAWRIKMFKIGVGLQLTSNTPYMEYGYILKPCVYTIGHTTRTRHRSRLVIIWRI